MPEHSIHISAPRFRLAQSGSERERGRERERADGFISSAALSHHRRGVAFQYGSFIKATSLSLASIQPGAVKLTVILRREDKYITSEEQ